MTDHRRATRGVGVLPIGDADGRAGRRDRLPHQAAVTTARSRPCGTPRFRLNATTITAFIGPSGCGKSTVLRCLNRMNDLVRGFRFEGHVQFRGKDIYKPGIDPVAVRRFIGMVFQQPNPFATSIYNNVAFGLRLNGFKGNTTSKWKRRCAAPPSGTKSRTSCRRAGCRFPAASSNGCALPARLPPSRKSC